MKAEEIIIGKTFTKDEKEQAFKEFKNNNSKEDYDLLNYYFDNLYNGRSYSLIFGIITIDGEDKPSVFETHFLINNLSRTVEELKEYESCEMFKEWLVLNTTKTDEFIKTLNPNDYVEFFQDYNDLVTVKKEYINNDKNKKSIDDLSIKYPNLDNELLNYVINWDDNSLDVLNSLVVDCGINIEFLQDLSYMNSDDRLYTLKCLVGDTIEETINYTDILEKIKKVKDKTFDNKILYSNNRQSLYRNILDVGVSDEELIEVLKESFIDNNTKFTWIDSKLELSLIKYIFDLGCSCSYDSEDRNLILNNYRIFISDDESVISRNIKQGFEIYLHKDSTLEYFDTVYSRKQKEEQEFQKKWNAKNGEVKIYKADNCFISPLESNSEYIRDDKFDISEYDVPKIEKGSIIDIGLDDDTDEYEFNNPMKKLMRDNIEKPIYKEHFVNKLEKELTKQESYVNKLKDKLINLKGE